MKYFTSCFLNLEDKLLQVLAREVGHDPTVLRKMYD